MNIPNININMTITDVIQCVTFVWIVLVFAWGRDKDIIRNKPIPFLRWARYFLIVAVSINLGVHLDPWGMSTEIADTFTFLCMAIYIMAVRSTTQAIMRGIKDAE